MNELKFCEMYAQFDGKKNCVLEEAHVCCPHILFNHTSGVQTFYTQ